LAGESAPESEFRLLGVPRRSGENGKASKIGAVKRRLLAAVAVALAAWAAVSTTFALAWHQPQNNGMPDDHVEPEAIDSTIAMRAERGIRPLAPPPPFNNGAMLMNLILPHWDIQSDVLGSRLPLLAARTPPR
jgi:hypothetical protein